MKLLIGLGNPGPKYENTWHNAGFWALDGLAREAGVSWDESTIDKFQGILTKGTVLGETCIFLKPMTFMNLSGRSVAKVAQFYKIPASDWIALHDDIDVPNGKVRGRQGGGHGGHNGIRSMMEVTGRDDFQRIKLGVGRPAKLDDGRPAMDVADYVLKRLDQSEVDAYVKVILPEVHLRIKDMLRRPAAKA